MLEEVRITGLGVIDDATLELSPGFTVVTGETGAGKTMVVSGLGLLFGGRADPARVRPGADRASVDGRLRIDPDGPVARQVSDAGGDLDDGGGELVISRSVSAEGRSRAYAGGRSVPLSLLTYLADDLVAVHGQADQQQLRKPARQRAALDLFAGPEHAALLAAYQRSYHRLRDIRAELAELTLRARDRDAEAADLRRGLTEIERAGPASGEDIELLAEDERLSNADELHAAATAAHEALQSDPAGGWYEAPDVLGLLGGARHALETAARHDAALAALAGRLSEAAYLVSDVAAELASYAQAVEADPARLAVVQERRAELARLVRAYAPAGHPGPPDGAGPGGGAPGDDGPGGGAPGDDGKGGGAPGDAAAGDAAASGITAVLGWASQAAARLAQLEGADDQIAELAGQEETLAAAAGEVAGQLTASRKKAAGQFADDVTAELAALAMPDARLTAAVTPAGDFGPFGADEVELRLAAHPGAPELPLHKGASGGELSRVMLAIEVVFAGADPVPTFVFDEVDAGVGGKAAVEIGRRLARLARLAQVIVVTHLPQVAAFADAHLMVRKAGDGSVTSSGVTRLDEAGRVRELSRMLAGLEDSEFGRAHAGELLAAAAAERSAAERAAAERAAARRAAGGPAAPVSPSRDDNAGPESRVAFPAAHLARLLCDEGAVSHTHRSPSEQVPGPARPISDGPDGPPDQEPDQATAAGRHRHHRPCRPGPGERRGADPARCGGGAERRAGHHRPVPQPRPAAASGGRDPGLDDLGADIFEHVSDGQRVRLDGDTLYAGDEVVAKGVLQDSASVAASMEDAKAGLADQLKAFAANTIEYISRDSELLIDGIRVPDLRISMRGLHVLVVARGYRHREDLQALRAYIREFRPVIVAVDGGANALIDAGYKPP